MVFHDIIDDPRVRVLIILGLPVLISAIFKGCVYVATHLDETFRSIRWFVLTYFLLCIVFLIFHVIASRPDACLHSNEGLCFYLRLPTLVATYLDRVFFSRPSLCVIYNACRPII